MATSAFGTARGVTVEDAHGAHLQPHNNLSPPYVSLDDAVLVDDLHRAAFRGSPLGRPVSIPASRIGKVSVDDIVKYRENLYTGDNTSVVAVGASFLLFSLAVSMASETGANVRNHVAGEKKKSLC